MEGSLCSVERVLKSLGLHCMRREAVPGIETVACSDFTNQNGRLVLKVGYRERSIETIYKTKPGPPKKPKTPSGQSALLYCYNCAQKGHYGHECTERRMFNQTFPTSPFIYYYDDKYDIQQRDRRVKRKVKEIQKNGDFPRQFKRPHIEEADKRHHHDMRKSYSSRKSIRRPRENEETHKEMMRNREGEKPRRAHWHHNGDEDFPRGKWGSKPHSSGSAKNQKPARSFHHPSHYHRLREEKLLRESKRNKLKKRKCTEEGSDDNLFLIKQRKKKPKL